MEENNYFILVCILFALFSGCHGQNKVIAGNLGSIEGRSAMTLGSKPVGYAQFLGIPYARQPTRFQPSVLLEEVLSGDPNVSFQATEYGSECTQSSSNGTAIGSEDCLFLNIFAPQVPSPKLLPVIVFIHGAAFVSGNANAYTGARLLNRDVVLVSFNYRLGILGYLNMETDAIPGNAALYDALTVFRWVQKYIRYFGGDANLVTLAGQSSGSASVSHALLSPLMEGMFQRVIAASGSAIDVWALAKDPLQASLTVATYAGCYAPGTPANKIAIAGCMLTRSQQELIMAQNMFQMADRKSGSIGFSAVSPSIQKNFVARNMSMVPEDPLTVLESGTQMNVSLMMGTTRDDGGFALRLVVEGYIVPNNLLNNSVFMSTMLVPTIIRAIGINDFSNTISDSFTNIYLSQEARDSGDFTSMTNGLMDMLGVLFFKSASYRTAQLHQRLNPNTYFYSFDYEGNYTRHPSDTIFPGGVAHADDLIYIFQLSPDLDEKEQALSDVMVDYWVNFAYNGDPNMYPTETSNRLNLPNWPSLNSTTNHYLHIDADIQSIANYPSNWVIANKMDTNSGANAQMNKSTFLSSCLVTLLAILLYKC